MRLKTFWLLVAAALLGLLFLSFIRASEQIPFAITKGAERSSPGDWIKEDQIKVYGNRVVIDIDNPVWVEFADTNSMDPLFDAESHAIEIAPKRPEDIHAGDVISYGTPFGTVVHRVVEVGRDGKGIYYLVQGDNNGAADPFKVRFKDVKGVVVAVIY